MQECSSACAERQLESTLTFPRNQLPLPGFRCLSIIAGVTLPERQAARLSRHATGSQLRAGTCVTRRLTRPSRAMWELNWRRSDNKFPDRLILVSPSFPKMGRILLDGWLRVRVGRSHRSHPFALAANGPGSREVDAYPPACGTGASDTLVERIQAAQAAGARIIVIDAVSRESSSGDCRGCRSDRSATFAGGIRRTGGCLERVAAEGRNSEASGTTESASLVRRGSLQLRP